MGRGSFVFEFGPTQPHEKLSNQPPWSRWRVDDQWPGMVKHQATGKVSLSFSHSAKTYVCEVGGEKFYIRVLREVKFSVSQSARQEVLHESSVSSHIDIQLLLVTLSGIKDFSLSIEINRYTTIHIINIMMYSTLLIHSNGSCFSMHWYSYIKSLSLLLSWELHTSTSNPRIINPRTWIFDILQNH